MILFRFVLVSFCFRFVLVSFWFPLVSFLKVQEATSFLYITNKFINQSEMHSGFTKSKLQVISGFLMTIRKNNFISVELI